MASYWDRVLKQRITRRRALASAGAFSLSAAFLAACGGDDNDSGGGGEGSGGSGTTNGSGSSSLVTQASDDTGQAKQGGIWPWNHGDNEFNIDPTQLISVTSAGMVVPVYSQMVRYGKKVPPGSPTPRDIEGDAMESWESDDQGIEWTYKLRPNHKFDPRPPTNGRAMTVEDVKWSFERTEQLGPLGGPAFTSAGQGGTLQSIQIVDDEHVKIIQPEPYGSINEVLAYLFLFMAPIEGDSESVLDLRREMRGSGPFRLDSFQEGVSAEFSRNPDWYVENQPFLDGMLFTFIGEDAVLNSQFTAQQHWGRYEANALDVIDMKKRMPELLMIQQAPDLTPSSYNLALGRFFTDPRLRQAVSMVIDRDLLLKSSFNTNIYEDEGLDVYINWDSHLGNQSPNWLDPKKDGLGDAAKYWQLNLAEAKKLMDAAGYTGEELTFTQRANFQADQCAIISQFLRDGGFNVVDVTIPAAEWRDTKFAGPGTYDGIFFSTAVSGFNDDGYLSAKYRAEGRDHAIAQDIPALLDRLAKIKGELDPDQKSELIKDFQRAVAPEMYDVPLYSLQPILNYNLFWPWFKNNTWSVPGFSFQTSSARPFTTHFVDQALYEQHKR